MTGHQEPSELSSYYEGVDGWLLLLCVSLTVLGPLGALWSVWRGYRESAPYFAEFPGWATVFFIDAGLMLALTGFGVFAGLGLWGLWPNAVRTAKVCLLCIIGYSGLAALLPLFSDLPADASQKAAVGALTGSLRPIAIAVAWYVYLGRSRRVQATYAD
jgi:hypothetical protein